MWPVLLATSLAQHSHS